MKTFRPVAWIGIGLALLIALICAMYLRDMHTAYNRIEKTGSIVMSPLFGEIEYVTVGAGAPVLVIHGGGGGYDQGELIAEAVLGEQFLAIIPSRFGYLGSTLPEGATWDDQADAYRFLLDELGIEQVAVVAMSQGGPSALLFALLHPDRVSSLACISCGVVASSNENQQQANRRGNLLKLIFNYDLTLWASTRLLKSVFIEVMGASPEVVASLTPEQLETVDRLIDFMNPAAPRSAGAAFDNKAALPGDRIAAITAPTLLFHAKDDTLQLYHNAGFAAATIKGARLAAFDRGGHLLMIAEQTEIRRMLHQHIMMPGTLDAIDGS